MSFDVYAVEELAKKIVLTFINEVYLKNRVTEPFPESRLKVLWVSGTNTEWRAYISTSAYDGRYYLVDRSTHRRRTLVTIIRGADTVAFSDINLRVYGVDPDLSPLRAEVIHPDVI